MSLPTQHALRSGQYSSSSKSQRGTLPPFPHNSDFWRAMKERHPFALTFARGPRNSTSRPKPKAAPSTPRTPIFPPRISKSFLRGHASTPSSSRSCNIDSLALPDLAHPSNRDLWLHHNTFPRRAPVYLHTPKRDLESQRPARRGQDR
jgi:hypothetical protein